LQNQAWLEPFVSFLNTLDAFLGSAQYFPFALLATGVFFTFYLKFPQIRFFNHAWRILLGKYEKPNAKGDASHFQALTTAISGTVGTGNIGGVALAIYLGGPAAVSGYRCRWIYCRWPDVRDGAPFEHEVAGGVFCCCHGR
jgi:AGCS family alanine or glycine:cation symporter